MSLHKFKKIFSKDNNTPKLIKMNIFNIDLSFIDCNNVTKEQLVLIARIWMAKWISGFEIKYINKYFVKINNVIITKYNCLCHNGAIFDFKNEYDFKKNLLNEFINHFNLVMFKNNEVINFKINDNTISFQFHNSFNYCFSKNLFFFTKFFYKPLIWSQNYYVNYEKDINMYKKIFSYLISNNIIKNIVNIINV